MTSEKEMLAKWLDKEFNTTIKVLSNYPKDKLDFKPHEVSRSAKELAAIFGEEESAIGEIANGVEDWWTKREKVTGETLDEIITQNKNIHTKVMSAISAASEEDLEKTFQMGPMTMRRLEAMWMLAADAIHHRGQFSVYLRMAGGKVPAIYGPSYDEKSM